MRGRGLQPLRYLGLLLSLLCMLAGCGSNGGSDTTGRTASRSRQLALQLQLSSEAVSTAPPAGPTPAQTRQVQPGDPAFLARLEVRLQIQGSDLVPPQVFLLDPAQQETATLEVAVPDTVSSTFEVLVSAFTSQGIEAYRGQTTVARGQTSAVVQLPRFAFVPVPATAANLQQTTFTFTDGTVFGLVNTPCTLATGTFVGDVGDFALTSGGSVASGSVTIGSCTFVVTTSSFPPGQGLQVGDQVVLDPCQTDAIDRRLIVTNASVSTTSSPPVVIPPDTTLTVPPPPTLTIGEDTAGTFQIVTSVSGTRPGTTTLSITVPPAHGTASLTSAGLVTYQPEDNFTGTDSLVVTVIVIFTDNNSPPLLLGTVPISISVTSASLVSLTVIPPNAQLAQGTTQAFTATGLFTDSSTQDLTLQVTWQSSDAAIATISNAAGSQGRATGIAPGGPIVISATAPPSLGGTITGTTQLSVTSASLVSLTVIPPNAQLAQGTTQAFTATGLFTDSSTQDLTLQVTWQSSDAAIATISNAAGSQGRATGIAPGGPIVISATAPPSLGGTITGTTQLSVTAASLVALTVTPPNAQLAQGTTQAFTATGLFTDSSTQDLTLQVTWQSSDAAIATISNAAGSQGRATGIAPGGPIVISAIAPPSLGGTITGTTQLSVLPFNNPPSFMLGPNQTVLENAGPQTVTPWATAIRPGPPDEADQAVNFIVSTSNNALFTVLPAISPNGALTYTPAVNTNGVAVVTVRLQDNGGTANGGMDTSPPQTFTISVVDTRPPTFASILAMPTLAGAGVPITITFSVSETLQSNPTVIVAGNPATFLRLDGLTYTYTYTVQGTEPVGAAIITITGTDLAGNVGLGESSITLEFTPPVAAITFPGSAVLTYTQVTVRGTAQDTNGVANVLVNGVAATSVDGFAHWEATLALASGSHVLAVTAEDQAGNVNAMAASATIIIGAFLSSPQSIAVEASGQFVVTDDNLGAVVRVDPITGNRFIVSDTTTGAGDPFGSLGGLAVEASGQFVVTDGSAGAVVRVDPTTGNRSIVSDANTGTGPTFGFPGALAVEASGQLVVVDGSLNAVLRVDPTTGNRSIVSDANTGTGPTFGFLGGLAVEASGQLVVLSAFPGAVVRVDPSTGNRSIVSDANTGTGPTFGFPGGLAVEASGQLVVTDGSLNAVVRVDPTTGNRSIVSDATTGTGPSFGSLVDLAVEASGQLVVVDSSLEAVVRVGPTTGNRTIISPNPTIGAGPPFEFLRDLAVEASGQLVVLSTSPEAVVRVDPSTGNRSIVSDANTGTGPTFVIPLGLAVEASGQLVVTDGEIEGVVRVDPTTGNRSIVSDGATGTGPLFELPGALAVEASGQLVVVDNGLNAVLRVDPTTGNRSIVSDATTGTGPPFGSLVDLAVEASGQLVVTDGNAGALLRVDPTTGNRSIVSDATTGTGPPFGSLVDLAVEASGQLIVTDGNAGAVLRIDPTTGNRSIVSDATTGNGFSFISGQFDTGIAVEASGQLIVASDTFIARIDATIGDRAIISIGPGDPLPEFD